MLDFSYASLRSPRYNCSICSGGFCITEEGQFQECSALASYLPPPTRVAFPLVCFGGYSCLTGNFDIKDLFLSCPWLPDAPG